MDVLYVSHGSPMMPLEDIPVSRFIQHELPKLVGGRPKAILVVSAHWDTREPLVSTTARNTTIHDFYGFPRELYQLRYDAPGTPEVADRAHKLLQAAGFKAAGVDATRGLDHGAWVPLWLAFPEADVPVFQVSIQSHRDAAHHFKLGRALASLRDEGVLIVCSGTTTHNLRNILPTTPAWATEFESWVHDCVMHRRYQQLLRFMEEAPHARMNHPTPDHFLPLMVALGAAGEDATPVAAHRSFEGSFSMSCYAFKAPPKEQ